MGLASWLESIKQHNVPEGLKVTGWGPFPLPGEKRMRERSQARAAERIAARRAWRARREEDERNATMEQKARDMAANIEREKDEIDARAYRIMKGELIQTLGLPPNATIDSIMAAVQARIEDSKVDRKYSVIPPDDAIYGRLEDIETEHQRLVRALRQRGVIE